MTVDDLRNELSEATDRVAAARRLVAAGYAVDLKGLDLEVGRLCEAIADIAPADRPPLKPSLVALTDELDRLGADLRTHHETLTGELRSINRGGEAARAYAKGKTR